MHQTDPTRRSMLLASLTLPWLTSLQGCGTPLRRLDNPGSTQQAEELLLESATAHGLDSFKQLHDLSVRYAGHWRPLVGKLQPALVDAGFRGTSEERLLLQQRYVAQAYTGSSGLKHVVRRMASAGQGEVKVWFNGEESHGADERAAAALVVDGYSLFLLGPLLLTDGWSRDRSLNMEMGGSETLRLDGRNLKCDVIRIRLEPGLGFSQAEQLALFIDREEHLMRCVRFTLDGLESTRGTVAEVQTFDHQTLHGVQWPTRFYERLLRPLPLPVHDWRLTGLDVDRGLEIAEISGAAFGGRASAAAATLAGR